MVASLMAIVSPSPRIEPPPIRPAESLAPFEHKRRMAIVVECVPQIKRICHQMLSTTNLPYETREDIVAGALEKVFLFMRNVSPSKLSGIENIHAFLNETARMKTRELIRTYSTLQKHFTPFPVEERQELLSQSYPPDFETRLDAPKYLEIFRGVINALHQEERNIAELYFLKGLPQNTIAISFGKKESHISRTIARILKKISSAQRKHGYL